MTTPLQTINASGIVKKKNQGKKSNLISEGTILQLSEYPKGAFPTILIIGQCLVTNATLQVSISKGTKLVLSELCKLGVPDSNVAADESHVNQAFGNTHLHQTLSLRSMAGVNAMRKTFSMAVHSACATWEKVCLARPLPYSMCFSRSPKSLTSCFCSPLAACSASVSCCFDSVASRMIAQYH
jgi:hypothetical protein